MSPQEGHSAGKLHTLLPQREQRYPPRDGFEWHAQRDGLASTVREGNPIISKELAVCLWEYVAGGVVTSIINSRKCCSLRATPYAV